MLAEKYRKNGLLLILIILTVSIYILPGDAYASTSSGGQVIAYNKGVIKTIGSQKVSGPCGIYSMAYSRAVLDGKFDKGRYSSIRSRIIKQYGSGTYCAYWYKAGGTTHLYSSSKKCYKAALVQIKKGRPCILKVKNGYTGNNHYVAVIGYVSGTTSSNVSIKKFIALDPAYGTQKNLSNMRYYNSSRHQLITF